MGRINLGKVLVGGLVAGAVMNVCDFVTYTIILVADFQANALQLHLDPAAMTSPAAMTTFITGDFLFGIVLVWSYAAIRPRFGGGPRTAIYAALTLFAAVTVATFGLSVMGMIPIALFVKSSIFSLVTTILATVVGAWLYTE